MKAASILIAPTVQLKSLPDAERDVLRKFFTEDVQGIGRANHQRWLRWVRALFNAEPGEGFQLYRVEERSGPFHKRHRAILDRLFESQERFSNVDRLHDWLKVGAGFIEWTEGRRGNLFPKPRTTSFPECSEQDMREFHDAMVDWLHTERPQRFLWRHLKGAMREEMLDAALTYESGPPGAPLPGTTEKQQCPS